MSTQSAPATPGSSPREQLMQLVTGYKASACLSVVAQLDIADLLAGGAKPISQLAHATRVGEDGLYRVLRALASVGVFIETAPRTFANTPASELMRSDTRDSVRDVMIWMGDEFHLRVYAELMHSVKTGGTAVKKLTGSEAFEYFEQDKVEGERFNAAMTSFSAVLMPAVLEAYDFSGLGTLADIAGGHGVALTSILKKHSDLRGILFDLPHVVSGAKPRIESLGFAGRCQIVAGDFFQTVPAADSYVLKNIIHDWDDARALTILKNCAGAMRGKGKVILIENVISPGNEPHFAKWLDIDMLTLAGGRERTQAEFAGLFSQAGLRLSRVVPTRSPVCVVEAVKG